MISQLLLLGFVIVFFAGFHTQRCGRIFSIPVFFNVYALLYFVVGLYIYSNLYHLGLGSDTLNHILWLCTIAVIAFNAGYLLFARKKYYIFTVAEEGYLPAYQSLLLIVVFALFAELLVIAAVGPYNYFFISRLDRFPIMKQYQPLLYLANFLNLALPFALARYFRTKNHRDKRMVAFILVHNFSMAILLISRSALAYNIICLFFFLEMHGLIKKRSLFIYGGLMAASMFFYKGVLYGLILNIEYESFNPGEFINWIRNTEIMLNNAFDSSDLPNNSYLLALKSIIIISPKEDALSEWFIHEFYADRVVSGLTYGFSGLIEGYMYAGDIGVFFHFFAIGVLFASLEMFKGSIKFVITICVVFIMFRIFRSEIYNFVKTFAWYYFYQTIFIVCFDLFLKWYSRTILTRGRVG